MLRYACVECGKASCKMQYAWPLGSVCQRLPCLTAHDICLQNRCFPATAPGSWQRAASRRPSTPTPPLSLSSSPLSQTEKRGDGETGRRAVRRGDGETGRRGDVEGRWGDGETGRETGRRGDGEMGRRGDGETGRRGDGETGRWRDGETGRRGNGETENCILGVAWYASVASCSFHPKGEGEGEREREREGGGRDRGRGRGRDGDLSPSPRLPVSPSPRLPVSPSPRLRRRLSPDMLTFSRRARGESASPAYLCRAKLGGINEK